LRALATTPALSEHLFVTSNTLDPELIKRLRDAMLTLHQDSEGKQILTSIKKGATAMVPVKNSDYDNLREILRSLRKTGVVQ
jgi:phosphonate transport system substrate-binding protein